MPYKDPEARRAAGRRATAKWRKAHPEQDRATTLRWRERNADKLRAHRKRRHSENRQEFNTASRQYHAEHRGEILIKKRARRLRRYGLTVEQYDTMLAAQGGRCALFAVCGATEPGGGKTQWAVDHDHATGRVRGLLCLACNATRVGSNTVESALAVARYLAVG